MKNILKQTIIGATVVIFTACGGGGGESPSDTGAQTIGGVTTTEGGTNIDGDTTTGGTTTEGGTSTEYKDCFLGHKYTYDYNSSAVGDEIVVNGVTFTIAAMPFVEYGTGDHYYIQFPVKKEIEDGVIHHSATIDTSYVQADTSCYPDEISGYPSKFHGGIQYYTSYLKGYDKFILQQGSSGNPEIKINKTRIRVAIDTVRDATSITSQETVVNPNITSLKDVVDWSKAKVDTILIDARRILLNHIKITRIGSGTPPDTEHNLINSPSSTCDTPVFGYSYTYKDSKIGDIVTVKGQNYTIVAFPFKEYRTGDHYQIKFAAPMKNGKVDYTYVGLNTYYQKFSADCLSSTRFAGYPLLKNSDMPATGYYTRYQKAYNTFRVIKSTNRFLSIAVNDTRLTLNYYFELDNIISQKVPSALETYDFRETIDWSKTDIDTTNMEAMQELLNYVEIKKIN